MIEFDLQGREEMRPVTTKTRGTRQQRPQETMQKRPEETRTKTSGNETTNTQHFSASAVFRQTPNGSAMLISPS